VLSAGTTLHAQSEGDRPQERVPTGGLHGSSRRVRQYATSEIGTLDLFGPRTSSGCQCQFQLKVGRHLTAGRSERYRLRVVLSPQWQIAIATHLP